MPKALIVEDQKETAILMQSILALRQIDVVIAERAQQGIEMMRESPPDIVFMDLLLPEIDGFKAIEMIKQDDDLKHIPVIAVTAASIANSHLRLEEVGADGFIAKPFKMPELFRILDSILK